MPDKRSQHELKRLIERAVTDVCGFPRPGLWFCVDHVQVHGHPPERLITWSTLHFLPTGSPFCCGEPLCHLGLTDDRERQVSEHVRRTMRLRQELVVEFDDRITVNYHAGVAFHYGYHDA